MILYVQLDFRGIVFKRVKCSSIQDTIDTYSSCLKEYKVSSRAIQGSSGNIYTKNGEYFGNIDYKLNLTRCNGKGCVK